MYYIILFSLFTVLGFTETVSLITTRNDKSLIEGYLSTPNTNKKFPLLVFVDGSSNSSVLKNHEKLASRFLPHNIAILSVEKRGITKNEIKIEEFLKYDCFENRFQDYVEILKTVNVSNIPNFDGNCILLGSSEGGKIAPKINLAHQKLFRATVLIGSGGGISIADEMEYQFKNKVQKMSFFKRVTYKLRQFLFPNELKKTFNLMKKNPESLNIFGSKTWKWWASYLNYDLISDLLKIDNPIYMIHGELDEFVPILSANLIKSAFETANKKNFTLLSYSDLGHSMVGRDDIFQDLMDLINENLKKD